MKENLISIEKKGEDVRMCNIAEELEKRGIEQGINQGEIQGRAKELTRNIEALMKNMKLTLEEALDALSVSEEQRKQYYLEKRKR